MLLAVFSIYEAKVLSFPIRVYFIDLAWCSFGVDNSSPISLTTNRSLFLVGSFHLLQMLFDDYILYLIESHAIVCEEHVSGANGFSIIRNRTTGMW